MASPASTRKLILGLYPVHIRKRYHRTGLAKTELVQEQTIVLDRFILFILSQQRRKNKIRTDFVNRFFISHYNKFPVPSLPSQKLNYLAHYLCYFHCNKSSSNKNCTFLFIALSAKAFSKSYTKWRCYFHLRNSHAGRTGIEDMNHGNSLLTPSYWCSWKDNTMFRFVNEHKLTPWIWAEQSLQSLLYRHTHTHTHYCNSPSSLATTVHPVLPWHIHQCFSTGVRQYPHLLFIC